MLYIHIYIYIYICTKERIVRRILFHLLQFFDLRNYWQEQQKYQDWFADVINSGRIAEVWVAETDFRKTPASSAEVTTSRFDAKIFSYTREGFKNDHCKKKNEEIKVIKQTINTFPSCILGVRWSLFKIKDRESFLLKFMIVFLIWLSEHRAVDDNLSPGWKNIWKCKMSSLIYSSISCC